MEERIKGLEFGADDYLSKPFNTKELILRIGNILNRKAQQDEISTQDSILKVGCVALDKARHQVKVGQEIIDLTATEFRLLSLLMERKDRVQNRDNLLINVWDYDTGIETRTVDTHVRRLREKLGHGAGIIKTIRGIGYKIEDI